MKIKKNQLIIGVSIITLVAFYSIGYSMGTRFSKPIDFEKNESVSDILKKAENVNGN